MIGLRYFFALVAFLTLGCTTFVRPAETGAVNVLLITVDDMNWDSVGAFGNAIADITPHIDQLGREGRRFEYAYVAASNCSPSRVALQTGLYPQQSGATGFFYIDDTGIPTIATQLRQAGYFTGIINKIADSNPSADLAKYWDYSSEPGPVKKASPRAYGERSADFLKRARVSGQPFYLSVNIADPHKPNFNDPEAIERGTDAYAPSRVIAASEVGIPGFLPDVPGVRDDVRNYYNSVKRADDAVGEILAALRASGLEQNTLVIFLSDHGMPFPFAKSSVYQNGLRTPLIMRWPGRIEAGDVVRDLVSTIDLMPTIFEAAGVPMPVGQRYLGKSLLAAAGLQPRPLAFGSFDENAAGYPVPMRGVLSREWGYAFNAWADGEHTIRVDDMNHATFRQMRRHALDDPGAEARLAAFLQRPVEELCHLAVDPDCLANLAADPAYAGVLEAMRKALRAQMVATSDYLLEAFDDREDTARLRALMREQHDQARDRAARLQWKRQSNMLGSTRSNTDWFRKGPM